MKKFYSISALVICLHFISIQGFSQDRKSQEYTPVKTGKFKIPSGPTQQAPGCDTANLPLPQGWNILYYVYSGNLGFVTGNNSLGDRQKANFYDVSATANTFLTKILIAFAKANGPDLSKIISVRVFDGTSGLPGNEIGVTNLTLGDIKPDVDSSLFTEVEFNPAITLPASKKFFVSVDFSTLDWDATPKDSLTIYSTDFDEPPVNQAWEQWDDSTWHPFNEPGGVFESNLFLIMFPLVSTNQTCSLVTPVKLSSFSATASESYNKLSWTTVTEIENAGFELERSPDGTNFKKIDFVPSNAYKGNSDRVLHYGYTDLKPLVKNNYYRLKQLDKNGKYAYSNVVLVNRSIKNTRGIVSFYPNPAKNTLNLKLAAPAGSTTLTVTNMTGVTLLQKNIMVTGDNQLVQLNISALPKGTYFVKILGEPGFEKFVKD